MSLKHFSINDSLTWYQAGDKQIFISNAVDESNSDSMSVGFGKYNKGERNGFIVNYDEVLIVTKGTFTIECEGNSKSAKQGEVLFFTNGSEVMFEANEDAEVVFVTYPHWLTAVKNSKDSLELKVFKKV